MDRLKEHLNTIANQLTSDSTLEDVYEQLALLSDIEKSEKDEKAGRVFTTAEVKDRLKEWVR
ncbi:MAG: hypothetical protein R8G66_29075 [Cytophagales bacterium]|nr:hypothetical protein [Cytophagales bacterium]